ncbi:hypothetical protein CTEN210_13285 [Chaetoceros tenuissimus]|uniref:Uncharacterized protein n=1 Tax=Chaetoceros tenuissimus TaxID=426638 RepID=A0AAD3HBA0_9STRA|nr:hypothetical protein CTEN210_13285 [Chaetoceros tenuissimus]
MSIFKVAEKHENLICRIKETIAPLQEKKLWNDEAFFKAVEHFLTNSRINEKKIFKIVADALFNLKVSQPKIEHVKKLVEAFPEALKRKDNDNRLPIEQLTFYAKEEKGSGTKYISTLALEGLKHNVGGENMRGGLLCVSYGGNTLQRLSKYCYSELEDYLQALKDLRRHKLLLKKDIVELNLLYHSCIGEFSLDRFQFYIGFEKEALIKTTVNGIPLMHAVIKHKQKKNDGTQSNKESFKRYLKYSLGHYKHLLFLKDDKDQTALDQAIKKFGERETMTILKEVLTTDKPFPILHQVIVHQPKYYNLFLQWVPSMFHLRDENGRTPTQVMLAMNRKFLYDNPSHWIHQTADQLEEKDPKTTLRPFASVAYGILGDLDLSYQILLKHPSVIDVILEEREEVVDENNDKKRNAEDALGLDKKKKK